ncbi:hypothetical protein [Leifsonia xyli]|uniref:hypothetical protein n=1 Tax=Leifsonia xyli TaxID=1575 RepID=UPI000A5B7BFF|nr:hypothetical protein [Leifsonia xyli]
MNRFFVQNQQIGYANGKSIALLHAIDPYGKRIPFQAGVGGYQPSATRAYFTDIDEIRAWNYKTYGKIELASTAMITKRASREGDLLGAFTGVRVGAKFSDAIQWMADSKLSTGTATEPGPVYGPKESLTRAAMAAFLFRRAGAPSSYKAPAKSPFTDVPTTHRCGTAGVADEREVRDRPHRDRRDPRRHHPAPQTRPRGPRKNRLGHRTPHPNTPHSNSHKTPGATFHRPTRPPSRRTPHDRPHHPDRR